MDISGSTGTSLRRWRGWVAAAAGMLTTAILVGGAAPSAAPVAVDIKDFKFSPPSLTVRVGTTVTWINHDEETHTVTSAASGFTSTGLSHDETFARTFDRAGTYSYYCALHPQMRATLLVK
jgi:plastocyanin